VPPQIACFCTTWHFGETRKSHFFHSNAVSVHCQNSTSRSLIYSVFLTHDSYHAAEWLPKSCSRCVRLGAVGVWFRRKEVESAAAVGLRCMHNACAPRRCLSERKKCHLWCVWWCLTFVGIVRYPINIVYQLLVGLQAWRRTTPIFYTATDTVTDLVNIERAGNRQQDAMFPF